MSRIRPQDCSKLANNPKNDNDVTTFRHDTIVKVFLAFFVCLVKFSYWSMFHVNIITDTGIMIIFFYKGLTRNPEIRNIPVWVLPNIWRLRQVTKLGTNVSNRMLLNAAKFQGYGFYCFWVIKGKPDGGDKNTPPLPPHPPRLGLITSCHLNPILFWDCMIHLFYKPLLLLMLNHYAKIFSMVAFWFIYEFISVFFYTGSYFFVITGKFLWPNFSSTCFSFNHSVAIPSTITSMSLFSYGFLLISTI